MIRRSRISSSGSVYDVSRETPVHPQMSTFGIECLNSIALLWERYISSI